MTITPEQSKEYLASFDSFLIKSTTIIKCGEISIENFFKNSFHNISYDNTVTGYFIKEIISLNGLIDYNNTVVDYFIEEIVSLNGLFVALGLLIILYIILRKRD